MLLSTIQEKEQSVKTNFLAFIFRSGEGVVGAGERLGAKYNHSISIINSIQLASHALNQTVLS